jgi:hypothetical protein
MKFLLRYLLFLSLKIMSALLLPLLKDGLWHDSWSRPLS